jgi:nucleotide-binding universal stress UspA family protein
MTKVDWKRICCPVDFSDTARAAMEVAGELARKLGAELKLLHVYPIPGYTFPDGSVVASPKMLEELAEQAERHLKEWKREAEAMGCGQVSIDKASGEAAGEIVAFARQAQVDLLVMGTHGRTGFTHALLGSVAERVVRRASCPVLTVRLPETKG